MSKIKINIWNRDFSLPVVLECYDDEQILASQNEAFDWIKSENEQIEKSLESVERYVIKNDSKELTKKEVDNIFKYVMPKTIYIPHVKKPTVVILCNYKFDPEHGLAVVFENGKFKKVDSEDAVL